MGYGRISVFCTGKENERLIGAKMIFGEHGGFAERCIKGALVCKLRNRLYGVGWGEGGVESLGLQSCVWVVAGGVDSSKAALRAAHSKTWRNCDCPTHFANCRKLRCAHAMGLRLAAGCI